MIYRVHLRQKMSFTYKPQINILHRNKMFLRKYADSNKLNLTLKILVIHLCGSKNICVTFYLMASFSNIYDKCRMSKCKFRYLFGNILLFTFTFFRRRWTQCTICKLHLRVWIYDTHIHLIDACLNIENICIRTCQIK